MLLLVGLGCLGVSLGSRTWQAVCTSTSCVAAGFHTLDRVDECSENGRHLLVLFLQIVSSCLFLVVFAAAAILLVLGPITFETCVCWMSLFVTGEAGFAEKEVQVEAHIPVLYCFSPF